MIYKEYFYSGTVYYIEGRDRKEKFFSGFISVNRYITTVSETLNKIKSNVAKSFSIEIDVISVRISVFNKV